MMGVKLVKLTYVYAADIPLNPNEFRLLAWMSMTALDDDETPRYFDSRESSALALGRRVVDDGYGDEADQRERTAAFEAVKVAQRGLCAIGAIERVSTGRNGRRSEYAIRLDVLASRRTAEFMRRRAKEGSAFHQGKGEPSAKGRASLPPGEGRAFPSGTTEEPQGTTAGTTTGNGTTSPGAVDNVRFEVTA
ncbi:hypothetical protein IC744_13960 [Microbacterium hominis]|uniref:hypothetical protein n=1 Tax=Microbacterium TaxID=33882 RepID=UPI00168AF597|nr:MULTISPECIES: hypothetical protein [Microbacterium]QOC24385.1 hypothetical protein IC745_08200 [Microbacterium hominis]QOC28463.1 hypothetical protein IC744_13960 [Microbacterium hominis]QYF96334.1 hypothetical protein KY498_08945 [Microbacterium sp. PAMC21962]